MEPETKIQGYGWKCISMIMQINLVLFSLFGVIIAGAGFYLASFGFNNDAINVQPVLNAVGVFGLFCTIDGILMIVTLCQDKKAKWSFFIFFIEVIVVAIIGFCFIITGAAVIGKSNGYINIMKTTKCNHTEPGYDFEYLITIFDTVYQYNQNINNGTQCQRKDCNCDISDKVKSKVNIKFGKSYPFYSGKTTKSDKLVKKFSECNTYQNNDKYAPSFSKMTAVFMYYIEKEWTCSGFCTQTPLYMFTNVEDSPAISSCLIPFSDSLKRNKNAIGSISIIAGLQVLVCMMLCGKLVSVKYKENKKNKNSSN